MNERIKDKVREIEKYLDELHQIVPESLDEYRSDFKAKAACERYAERIIGAIIDLALLIINDEGLPLLETDLQAFDILSQNKMLSSELAARFQDAKRMRNSICLAPSKFTLMPSMGLRPRMGRPPATPSMICAEGISTLGC